MSKPDDHEASTVERILRHRGGHAPSPMLRARVLAAVDRVLSSGEYSSHADPVASAPGFLQSMHGLFFPSSTQPDGAPGGFGAAMPGTAALLTMFSLLLATTLSRNAVSERLSAASDRRLISFVERARLAGITLDADAPSTARLAGRDVPVDPGNHIMRSIDTHLFLHGEL